MLRFQGLRVQGLGSRVYASGFGGIVRNRMNKSISCSLEGSLGASVAEVVWERMRFRVWSGFRQGLGSKTAWYGVLGGSRNIRLKRNTNGNWHNTNEKGLLGSTWEELT